MQFFVFFFDVEGTSS